MSLLRHLFLTGVNSVKPPELINKKLCEQLENLSKNKNIFLLGFGKAALGFIHPILRNLKNPIKRAIFSVPELTFEERLKHSDLFDLPAKQLDRLELHYGPRSNHSDERVVAASEAMLMMMSGLHRDDDCLLVVVTGGGSALLCSPEDGVTLTDIVELTAALAAAGASISELNSVRRRLDKLKGGGILRHCSCQLVMSLILSDVIGDDLAVIASGPTAPDNERLLAPPMDIIRRYGLEQQLSPAVTTRLTSAKTVYTDQKIVHNLVIGSNSVAMAAIASEAINADTPMHPIMLTQSLQGDCDVVSDQLGRFLDVLMRLRNDPTPTQRDKLNQCGARLGVSPTVLEETIISSQQDGVTLCLLLGGETPVKVVHPRSGSTGGRCSHMALQVAKSIGASCTLSPDKISILFGATDGMDGATEWAGVALDAETLTSIAKLPQKSRWSVSESLSGMDSLGFWRQLDDGKHLIRTGMTGTNVMDIIIIMLLP